MIYFAFVFMMYSLPYKTKQFFFVLIKISIVMAAFYFSYQKLVNNAELGFSDLSHFSPKNNYKLWFY